ncbi:helix-turn-helix domain-containing protein [Rhodococcus aerolatus]
MELVPAPPSPALQPFVASVTGYRQRDGAPGTHRGLPSPWLTLVLTLDEPLTVLCHPDPTQPGGSYDTLLGGLHTVPALLAHPGRQSGVQVALRPLGARALLGLPAGELAGLDVRAEDVLGPDADELRARLLATPGWPARFAAVEDVITRRIAGAVRPPDPEVARAWSLITRSGGRAAVSAVAADVGWGERRLHRRLTAELGVGPKTALRLVRFHATRTALAHRAARGAPTDLAGLAATHGYADQAHLTREFTALAGLPPRRWLAEEHGHPADPSKTTTP